MRTLGERAVGERGVAPRALVDGPAAGPGGARRSRVRARTLVLAGVAVLGLAACGGSSAHGSSGTGPSTTRSSAPASPSSSPAPAGGSGIDQARIEALDACTTVPPAVLESLVGGPLASAPTAHPGPGPVQCVFGANVGGEESSGSIQIAYIGTTGRDAAQLHRRQRERLLAAARARPG